MLPLWLELVGKLWFWQPVQVSRDSLLKTKILQEQNTRETPEQLYIPYLCGPSDLRVEKSVLLKKEGPVCLVALFDGDRCVFQLPSRHITPVKKTQTHTVRKNL